MPNFERIIRPMYREILDREPDAAGLAGWNTAMNDGMREWEVRERFLRSEEYALKFPSAGPPPPPPPPPPPGSMSPLRVVAGNRFVNAAGPVKLLGMVVAGDDPGTPGTDEGLALGWPMLTEAAIDLMTANRCNYSVFRLGPNIDRAVFAPDGEGAEFCGYLLDGAVYNLDAWESAFWQLLRSRLAYARSKGLYICLSLIDSWNLHHLVTPWSAARNSQHYDGGSLEVVRHAPSEVHENWVRKIVHETAEFENVLYLDGNESFKGPVSTDWVHGIRDIVKDQLRLDGRSDRLFSTNSGITEQVDFIVMHDRGLPDAGALPIVVDEYPTRAVDVVLVDVKAGWDMGSVHYIYWKGEHSVAEYTRCLAGLAEISRGGDPVPIPEQCPRLVRWQPRVHIVMNRHRQLIQSGIPEEGGFVFYDSTPRYGSGGGHPCNDEHPNGCLGCEDPRGGVWTIVQGSAQVRVENPGTDGHGFQCLVGPIGPAGSTYSMRIQALPDARDARGRPLNVAPDHSRAEAFTVGQPTRSSTSLTALLPDAEEPFRPIPPSIVAWMAGGDSEDGETF